MLTSLCLVTTILCALIVIITVLGYLLASLSRITTVVCADIVIIAVKSSPGSAHPCLTGLGSVAEIIISTRGPICYRAVLACPSCWINGILCAWVVIITIGRRTYRVRVTRCAYTGITLGLFMFIRPITGKRTSLRRICLCRIMACFATGSCYWFTTSPPSMARQTTAISSLMVCMPGCSIFKIVQRVGTIFMALPAGRSIIHRRKGMRLCGKDEQAADCNCYKQ